MPSCATTTSRPLPAPYLTANAPSLTQSGHSVRQALTAYKPHTPDTTDNDRLTAHITDSNAFLAWAAAVDGYDSRCSSSNHQTHKRRP
jgi:hypothetical protein